jgi:hypothetical protein
MAPMGSGVLRRLPGGRRDRHRAALDGWDPIVRPSRPPLVRRPPDGRLHGRGQGAVPAHEPRRRNSSCVGWSSSLSRPDRPVPSHGRVPRDVRDLRLAGARALFAPMPRPCRCSPAQRLCVPSPGHLHLGWSRCGDACSSGAARTDTTMGASGDPPLHRVRSHPGPHLAADFWSRACTGGPLAVAVAQLAFSGWCPGVFP